jgi:hypothetical protein
MTHLFYRLDGKTPVPCSMQECAILMGDGSHVLKQTTLEDGTLISTVFLGIDHASIYGGGPTLFETMVFPGPGHGEHQWRYQDYDAALAHHDTIVEALNAGEPLDELE